MAKYEMSFFFKLADAWNARPGNWSLFPDFLRMVYARRVITADEDRETEPVADPAAILEFPRLAAQARL